MTYFTKSTIIAALLVPATAFAAQDVGQNVGTTETEVRAALIDLGYEVQEIESENGGIEAGVTLESVAYEVQVALDTGLTTKINVDNNNDDDGDDDDGDSND